MSGVGWALPWVRTKRRRRPPKRLLFLLCMCALSLLGVAITVLQALEGKLLSLVLVPLWVVLFVKWRQSVSETLARMRAGLPVHEHPVEWLLLGLAAGSFVPWMLTL